MKLTGWYKPTQHPAREGWYLRDHRHCNYPDAAERVISLDFWIPFTDRRDYSYPGLWYVRCGPDYWWTNPLTGERRWLENINDASEQCLPWRGVLK